MKQTKVSKDLTKRNLSAQKKRLLELMQEINFGRIEKLTVREGEPVFNPSPRVVREVRFGEKNGPRCELEVDDFALKAQVVELFSYLTRMGNGKVESLDIKHGLPFRMNLEEVVRA